MQNKTIIKKAKVDDKYDFYKLHLDLDLNSTIGTISYIDGRKIKNKLSEIKSYKDFEKVISYLDKRNRSLYFDQIVNNLDSKRLLFSFSQNKGSNINTSYCKELYSIINTNTKKQIITDIKRNSSCLTYNVSDNLYILEKCLNDELTLFLDTSYLEKELHYGYSSSDTALSCLVKTCGFVKKDSFDKLHTLALIKLKESALEKKIKDIASTRQKSLRFDLLYLKSLESYIREKNCLDFINFKKAFEVKRWYSQNAQCEAINYIFSNSCEVKKENSHEFIKDNKMPYGFRSLFYYYRVRFGKANPKLARIARSDGSEESSLEFVNSLLSSLKMYTDDEILGIVSQFSDCKYVDPSVVLYRGLPKKYRYLMLSNKHVRSHCKG
jgi:hypothetical protein